MTITEPPRDAPGAGWYPDPDDASLWRYWNGQAWSDQRSPRTAAPATGATGATRAATRGAVFTPKALTIVTVAALAVGAIAWAATQSGSSSSPGSGSHTSSVVGGGGGDAAVKAGTDAIARGCSAFAGAYGYGPSVDDVSQYGAVAQFVDSWPANAYTGEPMAQSTAWGDFSFSTAVRMPGGQYVGYLTGHLGNGQAYSVEFKY